MSLSDDNRGRVPFALVGVVLLLGSATYAATLAAPERTAADRSVETALRDAEASARPIVRDATESAFRRGAKAPVVEAASTPAGGVINDSAPFEDAIRIRTYLAVADALDAQVIGRSAPDPGAVTPDGSARVVASLPPVTNASELRAAKRSVSVARFDDGPGARVRIENVSFAVRRNGWTVRTVDRTVAVDILTPAFELYERTARYQRRLDRGPLAGPGAGRFATAELSLYAWARGYRQRAGEPITNVVGTRHVAVAANSAALREQRVAFGRADPNGKRALAVGLAETVAEDYVGPRTPESVDWTATVLGTSPVEAAPISSREAALDGGDPRSGTVEATVGDDAHAAFVALAANEGLAGLFSDAYRAEGHVEADTVAGGSSPPAAPIPTQDGVWLRAASQTDERSWVVDGGCDRAPTVTDCRRTVAVEHERTGVWIRRSDGTIRTTAADRTGRHEVRVRIEIDHAPETVGPNRPVRPLFRSGGPLGGPNLRDVPSQLRNELLPPGGVDAVARAAATGPDWSAETSVHGDRPPGLRSYVLRDLRRLRDRVANRSVEAKRGAVARGEAAPAARLVAAIERDRASLVDAPATYDGAADYARVAARRAYLDRILARLEARAERSRSARDARETDVGALPLAQDVAEATPRDPTTRRAEGEVTYVPRGTPAYLTVSPVTAAHDDGLTPDERYHPLVTRNVNWITVPYGDAADNVVDAALDRGDSVGPAAAARTLRAAERAGAVRSKTGLAPNETLIDRRERLRAAVRDATAIVRRRSLAVLRSDTGLNASRRQAVVDAAFGRWEDGGRAIAATNGSLAATVAEAARSRGAAPTAAAVVESRLRVEYRDAVSEATVDETAVSKVAEATRAAGERALRKAAGDAAERVTERAVRRAVGRSTASIPAGLPLLPPYGWYATVNGWTVTVRGEYRAFEVRARYGPPDGGGVVRHVRDGDPVILDVDDDGDSEHLGHSSRIEFDYRTAIVVAVPAGGTGVGDVGGDADERSAGWPCPGFVDGDTGAAASPDGREPSTPERSAPYRGRPGGGDGEPCS